MDKDLKNSLILLGFLMLFGIGAAIICGWHEVCKEWDKICDGFAKKRIYSLYEDCQEACSEHNWEEAHKIVVKMKVQDSKLRWPGDNNMYEESLKKVILQESLSIIEEHGVNGLVRIVGLVKEYEADWVYRELLDVAKKIGDKELETRLSEILNNNR